jgi:hypothetical protein
VGIIGLLQKESERALKMQALSVSRQAVGDGAAPPTVQEYAYHDVLSSLGLPVDSLGRRTP